MDEFPRDVVGVLVTVPFQADRPAGIVTTRPVQSQTQAVLPDLVTDTPCDRHQRGLLFDGDCCSPDQELARFLSRDNLCSRYLPEYLGDTSLGSAELSEFPRG